MEGAVTLPVPVGPQSPKSNVQCAAVHYGMLLTATSPYLMFINNVTVKSS